MRRRLFNLAAAVSLVLCLATAVMWRIVQSPFGLCLRTVRDNPAKAESLADRIEYVEDDYRNVSGTCDAFASVGMPVLAVRGRLERMTGIEPAF